jgi:cytochrome c oxidase assembly protein subunit 15
MQLPARQDGLGNLSQRSDTAVFTIPPAGSRRGRMGKRREQVAEATESDKKRRQRIIGVWLLLMGGMLIVMVVLGGLTRLTDSGLSMVEWRPITGWLPPLSRLAWEQAFAAYQAFPEYQKVNAGMTLAQFQEIYWLEYVHRLWGRLIGVAFAMPLVLFLARRWIDRPLGWKLVGIFVLGGLQGLLGWYMVKSGMVDRPDVSQYRLVAHLGMALIIYGAILWVAMGLLIGAAPASEPAPVGAAARAKAVAALVLLTMLSGGFVAGLDAGYAYNTFPLMDGDLVPAQVFASSPWWLSLFEDVTTVQFMHRVLATATLVAVLTLRWTLVGVPVPASARRAANLLTAWVFVQFSLGVATLLSLVALPLAALHQVSALVLFTLALWCAFALSARGNPGLRVAAVVPKRAAA